MYMKKLCTFDWLKTSLLLLLLLFIIIIIIYYYYYYSIIMQNACKVVKQVQITNCTHTFKILSVLTHYDVFSYT